MDFDFEQATPEVIAAAIAEELGRKVVYRDAEYDGAASPQPTLPNSSELAGDETKDAIPSCV